VERERQPLAGVRVSRTTREDNVSMFDPDAEFTSDELERLADEGVRIFLAAYGNEPSRPLPLRTRPTNEHGPKAAEGGGA
jgi:hypothetical protein